MTLNKICFLAKKKFILSLNGASTLQKIASVYCCGVGRIKTFFINFSNLLCDVPQSCFPAAIQFNLNISLFMINKLWRWDKFYQSVSELRSGYNVVMMGVGVSSVIILFLRITLVSSYCWTPNINPFTGPPDTERLEGSTGNQTFP